MPVRSVLVTLFALVGSTATAQPRATAPRVRVWVEPWTIDVPAQPHERPMPSARAWTLGDVRMSVARGHRAACQIVIATGAEPVRDITPVIGDFRGASGLIPREQATLYRARTVRVTNLPSWYLRQHGPTSVVRVYDPLEPLGAEARRNSISLGAGEIAVVWLDIDVPRSAAPGEYAAEVELKVGQASVRACGVTLDVTPVALSPLSDLPILAGMDLASIAREELGSEPHDWMKLPADAPVSTRMRRLIGDYHDLLQQHGVHGYLVVPLQSSPGTPDTSIRSPESAAAMLDTLGRELAARSAALLPPGFPCQLVQPTHARTISDALAAGHEAACDPLRSAIARARAAGWLDAAFVLTPPPGGPADYECARAWARCAHQLHAAIRVVSTLPALSLRPYGEVDDRYREITDDIDIVAAPAQFDHEPTLARLRAIGKPTWLQPDRPPFSGSLGVGGGEVECRSVPWQAWLSGHSAIWIPRTGMLHALPEQAVEARRVIGGGRSDIQSVALAYSGRMAGVDGLLPSIRLKRLSLGAQEYVVLRTLEQEGKGESARQIASSLIHARGTAAYGDHYADGDLSRRVTDPLTWDQAAQLAWRELTEATGHATLAPDAAVARHLFLEQARGVWTWVDGTSISASDPDASAAWRVNVTIGVRNDTPRPIRVMARAQGPIDLVSSSRALAVPPGDFRLVRLEGACNEFEPDLHGHVDTPIRMRTDAAAEPSRNSSTLLKARLAVLMAPYAERSIRVDGDLADWPPIARNAAGNFRPVGQSQLERLRPDGAPHRADREGAANDSTTVWLCRDAERLLIAARCRTSSPPPARGSACVGPSALEFDDLIPRAGDLLELLIDPSNRAGAPDDLLYVTLWRNGNWFTARGVPTSPPIGRLSEWQPAVEYAVRESTGGWVAEASIPLRSFGVAVRPGSVWGINLARFAPERGEYASWAAVPRHCYAPRTLGRLIWLPRPLP